MCISLLCPSLLTQQQRTTRTHARTASTRAAAETPGGVASKNTATLAKQQQIAPTPPPAAIQAETLPLPPPPLLLPPPTRSPSLTPTCASQSLPPSPLSSPRASHPATPLTHYYQTKPPARQPPSLTHQTRRDSRTLGPSSRRTLTLLHTIYSTACRL